MFTIKLLSQIKLNNLQKFLYEIIISLFIGILLDTMIRFVISINKKHLYNTSILMNLRCRLDAKCKLGVKKLIHFMVVTNY